MSKRYIRMSDAAAILRDVYGHGAAKKIARRFNVAVRTSKAWLAGRFPENRTNELAAVVRAELERIDARNNEIRKRLGIGNGGGGLADTRDEVAGRLDIECAGAAGPQADGLGFEVADA